MTTQDDDAKFVCHNCIGDQFLANEVQENGNCEQCAYCGETLNTFTLEQLADRIHEALQAHFEITPDEPNEQDMFLERMGITTWEREGYQVSGLISGMADLSDEIAEDVTNFLSNLHGEWVDKVGWEGPYEPDVLYEEREPDDQNFRDIWEEYSNEIRSHSRFFSAYAEEMLNNIFGDLSALRTWGDKPVIREIGIDDSERFVWRARRAESTIELAEILKSPTREIGPPPSRLAKAGRMNPEGIPVFYGALEEDTCVAEVRALVGSHVVLAKFEFLRAMRLLDFGSLAKVYDNSSYFDPECAERRGRAAFFRWLVKEISRPVMPQDEAFEYIATQALSEYLANKAIPRLDGIIFYSTQTGGGGQNLVLFNHASKVELYELPEGSEVTVDIDHGSEDDENNMIVIRENIPSNNYQDVEGGSFVASMRLSQYGDKPRRFVLGDSDDTTSYAKPALRLELKSIVVLDIKGLKYDYGCHTPLGYRPALEFPAIQAGPQIYSIQ